MYTSPLSRPFSWYSDCMVLKNKLHITNELELAKAEERLSKKRAQELIATKLLTTFEVGTFRGLSHIHHFLFQDIYDFAGTIRTVNLTKGNFRFAPVLYLTGALEEIDKLPHKTFDDIIAKYVEMNVAHPFREGNGRSMRLWLDAMLLNSLELVVDWTKIDKKDYLLAMERSPVKDTEIKWLLKNALSTDTTNQTLLMRGIDTSYAYEGYSSYRTQDL